MISHLSFFRTGLSLDYSFWKVPVNGVAKCYNGLTSPDFTYARQCFANLSDDSSTSCIVGDYCPNSVHNSSDCAHFFCSKSKTCVEYDKTCDGICHCMYCEDETFEGLCEDTFPEAATIKCVEANRSSVINITILATPCNGVRECLNINDENCQSEMYITNIIMMFFFLVIFCGWMYIHFITQTTIRSVKKIELINEMPRRKGDDLAKFKVHNLKYNSIVSFS